MILRLFLLLFVVYFSVFFISSTLDDISYHNIADETLDAIAELFEDLGESPSSPTDYDVQLSVRLSLCPDRKLVFCNGSSIFYCVILIFIFYYFFTLKDGVLTVNLGGNYARVIGLPQG